MSDEKDLAERFELNRDHLRAVAYRILGSRVDVDDAVQETWLRLARTDARTIENLKAWLTAVVARICLNTLRSRKTRREDSIETVEALARPDDVQHELEIADSVGLALLMVLEALTPAERIAFVLHDMFDLSFDEIAPIIRRTPVAARKLASRARQRVQQVDEPTAGLDRARRQCAVSAFLTASQTGDLSGLLALLDPDVVLRSDAAVIAASLAGQGDAPPLKSEIHGSQKVADVFNGRARAARVATIDGEAGLVIAFGATPRMVFEFVIVDDRIIEISLTADPRDLEGMDLEF